MKITAEISDYSEPAKSNIRVHNHWNYGDMVELEIDGERYTVKASELISAVQRCELNIFGE